MLSNIFRERIRRRTTRWLSKAIEQYQKVLDSQEAKPSRDQKVNSAKGIAYLYLNMKKFDDAKKYYRMASDMDSE